MTIKQSTIDTIIHVALIALVVTWSITIIEPFIGILLWAIIIAVSAYSIVIWLSGKPPNLFGDGGGH